MKWSNKSVLVTGGAGFIGQHLLKTLMNKSAEVTVLDNFSSGRKGNVPSEYNLIMADVCDASIFRKIEDNVDYIFHLAAPSSVILFKGNPRLCVHSTVCGFMNIMEFAKDIGVKKVVYPSSGSIYGGKELPQSEDMAPRPANIYGTCKLACEHIAMLYSPYIPNVGLRIFAGYGPGENHKGEYMSPVSLFLRAILSNERPVVYGDGSQARDFVYIDDVIEALIGAIERSVSGIINVGSGRMCTFNQLVNLICKLLDKNIQPIYVGKPETYLEKTLADIKKMGRLLGISPLSIEKGLDIYLKKISI